VHVKTVCVERDQAAGRRDRWSWHVQLDCEPEGSVREEKVEPSGDLAAWRSSTPGRERRFRDRPSQACEMT
jgi:hypothetical protein